VKLKAVIGIKSAHKIDPGLTKIVPCTDTAAFEPPELNLSVPLLVRYTFAKVKVPVAMNLTVFPIAMLNVNVGAGNP